MIDVGEENIIARIIIHAFPLFLVSSSSFVSICLFLVAILFVFPPLSKYT
jgi:hypothetical protein